MKKGKKRLIIIAMVILCMLTGFPIPMAQAEVMPGVGVSVAATDVTMNDGTKIAETVTLRNIRTGTNIPPPAAGAELNFDYGGNPVVENNEPGTTYANSGGGWIKWANVDLKGGIASWKLCIASNGASRTFDVRISKPGEGLANAVSLGTLTVTGLATNWTMRWVRYPAASIPGQGPFIHADTNNYNAPAEEPSWATIADSKLDGICDVYYIFPNADSQFTRLSLTLKEEPSAPAEPYNGNLVFNVSPGNNAAVTLQNLATGAMHTANSADGRQFNVTPGTYGYTASAAGYNPKIGMVEITGANTAAAPLIQNVIMWPKPASSLNILSSPWNDQNITNNNGTPSWPNGAYVEYISNNTWFKWNNVDLKGGITSWETNIASGNLGNYSIDLRVAPAGSTPTGTSPNRAIPASAQSLGEQTIAVVAGSTGWGAPGITAKYPAAGSITDPIRTGLSDVYIRCGGGDFNLSRVTLSLKSDVSVQDVYDVAIAARPYSAAVAVTSLDGNTVYKPKADGKTYSLDMGFYKYSASADGHLTKTDQIFMVDKSKKVYAVLLPSGGTNNRYEAENITAANRPGSTIQNNAQYSGGQAIALGASENVATFSNIPSEYSGIAEVKIRYSGVNSGYINVKANNETPKTIALDSSGMSSLYLDANDGNNSIRISSAPTGFILDYIDVWSLTTAGSVDPNETDEPYVWTKNPVLKSIYTADPEAHVWPTNPNKLMLYPSHDRYPAAGCNRMDMYHVFSTTDLTHFEDEGEILRRADLPDWAVKNTGLNADSFMWAPDAAYYDGYYYFYNPVPRQTNNWGATWETSVVRSIFPDKGFEQIPARDVQNNPGKEWSGFIRDSGGLDGYANMYDVCVRVYDDRVYMYNGASQTLWQGELKSDMVTVVGGKLTLVSSNNQNTANQQGDPAAYNRFPAYHEGPSAFRRNGIYYLIYPGGVGAVGGLSGDSFHYATSTGPLGPWTYRGVFFNPHGNGTSHGSVVEFKGEYYWNYHTGNLPDGSDQTRSVCMDKIVFDDTATFDDGTKGMIVRFTRTFEGVPGLDDVEYTAPTGIKYGPTENANVNVTWGSGVTKNKDAAAENGWVLSNVGSTANAASAVTLSFDLDKAQRARLRFHYSTTSNMPHLNLTVNGKDYNTVNFPRTGGRSFFSDLEFTPGPLQAGTNTVVIGGAGAASATQASGNIRINYIEVIPLDEDAPTGLELRRSGNHVSLINYTESAVNNVRLVYAIYDAEGRMVYSSSIDNVSVAGERAVTKIFEDIDVKKYPNCTAKAFAWDQSTYTPICATAMDIVMHNQYELGYAPNTP